MVGILSIDYFISSDVEVENAQQKYSETLYLMRGLGTVFVDHTSLSISNTHTTTIETSTESTHTNSIIHQTTSSPSQATSQRQNMLYRQALIESIGLHLPRAAHLYIVANPLSSLHPQFDSVLSRILLQVI